MHEQTGSTGSKKLEASLRIRANAWQTLSREQRQRVIYPFAGLLVSLLALAAILVFGTPAGLPSLPLLLTGASLLLSLLLFSNVNTYLLAPFNQIKHWTSRMRGGQLHSRVDEPEHGDFAELANDLNGLAEFLQNLSQDVDIQVRKHTEHLEQKNRALEIIYDVAASVNVARDLEELLTRFLHTLVEVVHAEAAVVRLCNDDGQMKLIASTGLSEELVERERLLPVNQCACGEVCENGRIQYRADLQACNKMIGLPFFKNKQMSMIAVPLQYRNKILGAYNLFITDRSIMQREDIIGLLTNIGRHLGMAIDKARQDNEAYRLSIMEERTSLAHELHDSLAQTIASLRFQVRVLDETLHTDDEAAVWREVEKIENSLDEAYTEIRELITHFRAPIDNRGLIPAVRHLVDRFRNQTDIHIYFQENWHIAWLPAEVEVQVVHIVQEALTNIRKHSQAQNVRVLMQSNSNGECRILIEDDGIGIGEKMQENLGEHVGLSIMEERARRIGGELRIESEPGEGAQVQLTFKQTSGQPKKRGLNA